MEQRAVENDNWTKADETSEKSCWTLKQKFWQAL